MTPFVALWAWGAGLLTVVKWGRVPWPNRFLAAIGLPMLIAFSILALGRPARGHWILPGAATLIVLVAVVVVRGGRLGKWLIGGTGLVCLAGLLVLSGALHFRPQGVKQGWRALADAVNERQPRFVIAQDYHVAAHMAYHLRPLAAVDFTAVGEGGKSFRNWWRPEDFRGRDAVIVWEKKSYPTGQDRVRESFESLDPPITVSVPRYDEGEEFVLVRARSYRPPPSAR